MLFGGEGLTLDVRTLPAVALTGGKRMFGPGCFLLGWTVQEDTGAAPATVMIFTGEDANSQLVDQVTLAASGFYRANPGQPGEPCESGVFVDVTAGQANVSVTIGRWVR